MLTDGRTDGQTDKPVFILETDLFGEVKPNKDQFLSGPELYKAIDQHVPASHLKAIQRVGGMWRIYLDNEPDRESLISTDLSVRNKLIRVYSINPRVKAFAFRGPQYLRVRVKNVPCSAEDGQILRALELLGCKVHSMYRERLRVDGMLTNCQTGDRILMCDPVEKPLPRTLYVGKYRAIVIHKDQMSNNENTVCNKCFQKGHKLKECTNDWVCKLCKGVGHKQSECTATFSDEQDDEYTQVQDYASDAGTDADASSEGTTTEENPSESEADAPSQSILQPKPIRLKRKKKNKSPVQNKAKDNSKSKKQGHIDDWYTKDQNKTSSANAAKTPKSRNDKRSATTPTEELRSREGPPQRSKP